MSVLTDTGTETVTSDSGKPDLSVKKEGVKHLKVRTDLKGGLAHPRVMICSTCHGCKPA